MTEPSNPTPAEDTAPESAAVPQSTASQTPPTTEAVSSQAQIDQAVAQGGAYEVLRKRLSALGARVQAVATDLNARRLAEFGDSRMALMGRVRIRTENNCVGRDIVQVGDHLLFGFNVFLGLKTNTRLEDVFGLYRLVESDGSYDVQTVELAGTFLSDQTFMRDFEELYAYYRHARLLQLAVRDGKLLAAFQIGERITDMRVFRWTISNTGELAYVDARGERDILPPSPFDFAWMKAGREMEVSGRFPHLNILDTLFVETNGGDLTIKVENNTESGEGIYSEPVADSTQSLDDASFEFAQVGSLILLKVLPYREKTWRGLVYNTLTRKVVRNDAILQACVQLPEDHGIIFPGGYYLQNGEHKAFDASMRGMGFNRMIRSPNGEDVLYVFYEPDTGTEALFVYNMIGRELQSPVFAHGYASLPDGRMVLFHAESQEPTRVHQMQVWQTPFTSEEYAATRPPSNTFLGKLGNAELVRGISNLYGLAREIDHPDVSMERYELLNAQTRRLFDIHHWFGDRELGDLGGILKEIATTGESVIDEFEKVQSIRAESAAAMARAGAEQRKLLGSLQPDAWTRIQDYVQALNAITAQRGKLLTVRELRYVDTAVIDRMAQELQAAHERTASATGAFLAGEQALLPFTEGLKTLEAAAEQATTAKALREQLGAMQVMAADLDMLSELITTLPVDDATQRTRVVDAISGIYARLNQARARADGRRKSIGSAEAVAQFGAQFSLFSQGITSALGLATTPEKADEQLSRLMVQLEELEGQYSEHEGFLSDILAKREETLEVFEVHKQTLLEDRQRRAHAVMDAANRILDGLGKRTERLRTPEELNAFFASDPLILKLRELADRLRALKDTVKADDIESRLKAARDQAVRALRDRSDLFEDGGNVIKLGPRHKFSVNTQPLDLTLLPRGDILTVHLTGTEYRQPLNNPVLNELRAFWPVTLDSESPEVYRAEYLAGQVLDAAEAGREGLDIATLTALAVNFEELALRVREFAAPRYREGYEKGIHDHDAALILQKLLPLKNAAGPLIYPPTSRALAVLYWANQPQEQADWTARIGSAHAMQKLFNATEALTDTLGALAGDITKFLTDHHIVHTPEQAAQAATYLADELEVWDGKLGFTQYAAELLEALDARLQEAGLQSEFADSLARLEGDLAGRWSLLLHWLSALAGGADFADLSRYVPEAAALNLFGPQVPHQIQDVQLVARIDGLLGEHPRLQGGSLTIAVDDTLARLQAHREQFVPGFHRYQTLRQEVMTAEREKLRLSEFQARPLTSFVRNKLINDVYLPIIGDNLAKQMGTVGEGKRSDLMGLLMLISPPGYGKTTLMEYVAHRLGLVFMKISGPSLGHDVRSLDPAQAPNATSRQELEKLNLALEMGNNVMLYIDDIQHTNAEFLQKFISLTDGTRRIEGVWEGKTKTYDLRGRKFAVVMAGNPYTESGEVFKIPDMLANRADIYNLGDVLGGMEDRFLLSYLENALTSNPVLAPLATRDLNDLYLLLDRAQGKDVSSNALSHEYSAAELNEVVATLQKLMQVRSVLYRVNEQYIASAAQDDKYRQEPPFKLQGSYRNMNKLAEKVSAIMNDAEVQQLITDHYQGEAQLLTIGAEENLLKLNELRGLLTPEQKQRWAQIKAAFKRNKAMGSDESDTGGRMIAQLADIASGLQNLGRPAEDAQTREAQLSETLPAALKQSLAPVLSEVAGSLRTLGQAQQNAEGQSLQELSEALKTSLGLVAQMSAQQVQAQRQPQRNQLEHDQQLAQQLKDMPEALQAIIQPLLASLNASYQRQDDVNNAIKELVDVIRKRQTPTPSNFVRARTAATGRHEDNKE